MIPPDTGGGNTGVLTVGSRSMRANYYWWRMNWFEHQNFRDERAEAFTSLLWEGVYNYTYVARPRRPASSSCRPQRLRKCTIPRPSDGREPTSST